MHKALVAWSRHIARFVGVTVVALGCLLHAFDSLSLNKIEMWDLFVKAVVKWREKEATKTSKRLLSKRAIYQKNYP